MDASLNLLGKSLELQLAWILYFLKVRDNMIFYFFKKLESLSTHQFAIGNVSYDKGMPKIICILSDECAVNFYMDEKAWNLFRPFIQFGELSSLVTMKFDLNFEIKDYDPESPALFFDVDDEQRYGVILHKVSLVNDKAIDYCPSDNPSEIIFGNTPKIETQRMIDNLIIGQHLYETAEVLYEEMYGKWKISLMSKHQFTPPDPESFHLKAAALLPQKYMQGIKYSRPNALYDALKDRKFHAAKRIIRKTQYLTVDDFAKKYKINRSVVQKEWDFLWTLATGAPCCRLIPNMIAYRFFDWFRNPMIYNEMVDNGKISSLSAQRTGFSTALSLSRMCLLINSSSMEEYQCQSGLILWEE